MTDVDPDRAKKFQEFMEAQKKMIASEKGEAQKSKAEIGGDLDRKPGESTGQWLARRDAILEAQKKKH